MRYLVCLSYDGTSFNGFGKQPKLRTVQGEIENKLSEFFNIKTEIYGSGRTDRWVHAQRQYFHFDTKTEFDSYNLKRVLNQVPDLSVISIEKKDGDFHARFSSTRKTYVYKIETGITNVFERNYVLQYGKEIDKKYFDLLLSKYVGKHDFASFSAKEVYDSTTRQIFDVSTELVGTKLLVTINGYGFLRYMVRNMVGAVLAVIDKKEEPNYVDFLLANPERGLCHYKAPAYGLYLFDVSYDDKYRKNKPTKMSHEFKLKTTLHSHTLYCGHANNTATEMAKAAYEFGLTKYGISEHITDYYDKVDLKKFEYGFDDSTWLGDLIKEIKTLKKQYDSKMEIIFGLEAEYVEVMIPFFKKLLTHPEIEYIIFGNHARWENGKLVFWEKIFEAIETDDINDVRYGQVFDDYIRHFEMAIESNIFAYFAHPDFIFRFERFANIFKASKAMQDQFRAMCQKMAKKGIAFGFNVKGHTRKDKSDADDKDDWYYPNNQMWKIIKETGVKALIELDAHDIKHFNDEQIESTYQTAIKWGLKENLILDIDIKEYKKHNK